MNDEDWLKKRRRGPGGGCAVLWVGLLVAAWATLQQPLTAAPTGPTVGMASGGRAPAASGRSPGAPG